MFDGCVSHSEKDTAALKATNRAALAFVVFRVGSILHSGKDSLFRWLIPLVISSIGYSGTVFHKSSKRG